MTDSTCAAWLQGFHSRGAGLRRGEERILPQAGPAPSLWLQSGELPRLVIFAGPNRQGRSALYPRYLEQPGFPRYYIDAEAIARDLEQRIPDARERKQKVAAETAGLCRAAIRRGEPFAFATMMSTPAWLVLLEEARNAGFEVGLVFVGSGDPVRDGAAGQGDADPSGRRTRYEGAMRLLISVVERVQVAHIYDGEGQASRLAAVVEEQTVQLTEAGQSLPWVNARLLSPYLARAWSRETLRDWLHRAPDGAIARLQDADITGAHSYHGPVVQVTPFHVLQRVATGDYRLHDRALLNDHPVEVGVFHSIAYSYIDGGKLARAGGTAESRRAYVVQGLQALAQLRQRYGSAAEATERAIRLTRADAFRLLEAAESTRHFPELEIAYRHLARRLEQDILHSAAAIRERIARHIEQGARIDSLEQEA
ncbi:MAG TPA: hypothetical protein VNN09_06975 [Candidatus Competibacteraceae bacterium]|nr:hypothetical protein [Candidatus Competibacteraceae bacterium]